MPYQLKVTPQPHLGSLSVASLRPYYSSLGLWGAGAGVAVALLMGPVPIFQKDVLHKIPFVREYFIDNTPDCDKPF